jgi:hypothetical protein
VEYLVNHFFGFKAHEFESMKIIRYEESVYYANVDNFKYKIVKMCGINPDLILAKLKKEQERDKKALEKLRKLEKKAKNVTKSTRLSQYFTAIKSIFLFEKSVKSNQLEIQVIDDSGNAQVG